MQITPVQKSLLGVLKNLAGTENLVSVYADPVEPESFCLGILHSVDSHYAKLLAYDKRIHAHWTVIRLDAIYGVEVGSLYTKYYSEKLKNSLSLRHEEAIKSSERGNLLLKELKKCLTIEDAMSVELFRDGWRKSIIITGLLQSVTSSIVNIEQITANGESDGIFSCAITDILRFRRNDASDLRRLKKFLARKKQYHNSQ